MSERLALIIAASEFHDRRFRRLRAPALDAKQLSAVLKDPAVGGFTDVKVVLNQPRQVIEEAIEALFANRQPGDLALLYFSCHGITDRHGQLRFVTTPTRFDRLGSTTVSLMFVKDQMELSRARSKVVLLDCCHGGAFARGFVPKSADEMDLTGQVQSRGSVVIASSGAFQYAFEDDRLTSDQTKPSLFTGAVVEGLGTGEADRDGDGRISARGLFDYVYDRVRAATTDQTPTWSSIGVQGDIHLAWVREPGRRTSTAEPRGVREAGPISPRPDRPIVPQDASEALPLDADGWVRLLGYYIDCLEQEAALSGIPVKGVARPVRPLFRACRALIVGDPEQLQPVTTLPESQERACRQRASLPAGWLDARLQEPFRLLRVSPCVRGAAAT
jgi:hypothetical protein